MNIEKQELLKIANIARIRVEDGEVDGLMNQLGSVLSYAQRVAQLATELEGQQSTKNSNRVREDLVIQADVIQVLDRAPEAQDGYFVVPKIL